MCVCENILKGKKETKGRDTKNWKLKKETRVYGMKYMEGG